MDIFEQIGFIQLWGLTPPINVVDHDNQKESLNVLLSGTGDIRHILKTVADNCQDSKIKNLNFYIHEKQKEPVCRSLLLLEIFQIKNLSYRERLELFLDLYGNALITERSQKILDALIPELLSFIAEEKKALISLQDLVLWDEVKYKERDVLSDIINSWRSSIPFTMEKHRDQRLRFHYKDRYDYRRNLIDWDYQMSMKNFVQIIHYIHYRYGILSKWRQTGVAFESRFSSYVIPNRTMSSYLPGKKKSDRMSCLVRGYWGDIVNSPYMAFGIECDYEPEKQKLFKIANKQQCGHSVEIFTDHYRKDGREEELRKEDEDREAKDKKEEEENLKKQNLEKIDEKEEDNEDEETQATEQKKNQEDDKESEIDQKMKKEDVITLKNTEEEQKYEQMTDDQYKEKQVALIQSQWSQDASKSDIYIHQKYDMLDGFKDINVKIIPIFEDIEKIIDKKKWQNYFDIGVLGFYHSAFIQNQKLSNIFKNEAVFFAENASYLVPIDKEKKENVHNDILNYASKNKFEKTEYYKEHHYRFIVRKE